MSSIREQFEQQLNAGALSEPGIRTWCYANRDLIVRALKTQEVFDRGEPDDDHSGFYSYERDNAAKHLVPITKGDDALFKRGFFEGWNAARRFVIQAPP